MAKKKSNKTKLENGIGRKVFECVDNKLIRKVFYRWTCTPRLETLIFGRIEYDGMEQFSDQMETKSKSWLKNVKRRNK